MELPPSHLVVARNRQPGIEDLIVGLALRAKPCCRAICVPRPEAGSVATAATQGGGLMRAMQRTGEVDADAMAIVRASSVTSVFLLSGASAGCKRLDSDL